MNNFMETLEKQTLKKSSTREVFDSIIVEFKERLENAQFNDKFKNL